MKCSLLYLSLLLALAVNFTTARSRQRRESASYWWLADTSATEHLENPTLGALIGNNRPAEVVPSANDIIIENLSELSGLFGQNVPVNIPCECVPYYQCKDGDIITDGAGIIDIRRGSFISNNTGATRKNTHSKCAAQFLDVCCKHPDTAVSPIPGPIEQYHARCGRINPTGIIARVSGISANQAQFAEFPFMAAVLNVEQIGTELAKLYICGGSLIRPNVILTAAHCVQFYQTIPHKIQVRLGEWDTQRTYEPLSHIDMNVSRIIVHEKYNSINLKNDFALIFLDNNVTLSPHIDTACLPEQGVDYDPNSCFVSGWGKDKFGKKGAFQNILKKVPLPVMNDNTCQTKLRTTRLGEHFVLDSSFLCAGGGNKGNDACKGDGGSPLVCRHKYDPTTYFQVGIVAWGIGCGMEGIPGVYADVAQATPWISQQLGYYAPIYVL